MNRTEFLALSEEMVLEIARQLESGYGMKHVIRYAGKRQSGVHAESNAEHVFGMFYLDRYFRPLEDGLRVLDDRLVRDMILFHDFPEMMHGDVPYHRKTAQDEEREHATAREIFDRLPGPLNTAGYKVWRHYEQQDIPEAEYVNALDKIEPLFELRHPVSESSMKRTHFTLEDHLGRKLSATQDFPVMRRIVEVMTKDMIRRDVFWKEEAHK